VTVCVAVAAGGRVLMGADSAVTGADGSQATLRDPKVFRSGSFVVAAAGSGDWWHLIRYRVRWPRLRAQDSEEAVRVQLVDALSLACQDCDVEPESGETLLGIHGRIYILEGELVPVRLTTCYAAIGSGSAWALGALYATAQVPPRERVALALAAAAAHCATVRRPWRWASS